MGNGFRSSEHIHRPVEEVWAILTDWGHAPQWMNGIDEMSGPDPQSVAEGATVRFRARGADRESTVAVWSPPRRLVLRSRQGGVTATYKYTCEPEEDGTRVTLQAGCEMRGLGWRLIGPLIRYLMKRSDGGQIAALKRLLESGSNQTTQP